MIVISVGGSTLNPGEPNKKFIVELSRALAKIHIKHPIAVVAGGGAPARVYARAVRELGGSQFLADSAAILATRQNAHLLVASLGESAWSVVPGTFEEAALGTLSGKIVVMGGTIPGITTDTDAALLAELLKAKRIINISNVDGVYTADPRKDKLAKKLTRMKFSELAQLATHGDSRKPGENFVFDSFACKIIARSRIEAHFVGAEIKEIIAALTGKKHSGTVVCD
ncbi:MAG: UMP kinase [Candidatus Micrarchaeota archaeon]